MKEDHAQFVYFKQWLSVAAISGSFVLLARYKEAGHLPLVTLFEITFFYAWMINILYLLFIKKEMARPIQVTVLAIMYNILIWDIFLDKTIYPLNPLLKSYWLGIHVPVAILSYGAFALSFAISIYCIYAIKKGLPIKRIASFNSGLIIGGLFLLGICIVTGAVWAKSAWGRFWSWDPKETWALITFIIYAGAASTGKVLRLGPKWQAILSVSGFAVMLFTFLGVGFFLTSHHGY
jgi:ABC-type transport system involved in cytochrome c biogenesis permease subunit